MENSPLKGPPFDLCLSPSPSASASLVSPASPSLATLFLPCTFSYSVHLCPPLFLSVCRILLRSAGSSVSSGGPQARQRWDQATRKDHLVLYILTPAAMILSTAFKNIRRSRWITRRKSEAVPCNCSLFPSPYRISLSLSEVSVFGNCDIRHFLSSKFLVYFFALSLLLFLRLMFYYSVG